MHCRRLVPFVVAALAMHGSAFAQGSDGCSYSSDFDYMEHAECPEIISDWSWYCRHVHLVHTVVFHAYDTHTDTLAAFVVWDALLRRVLSAGRVQCIANSLPFSVEPIPIP